jgi:hypothetical protein
MIDFIRVHLKQDGIASKLLQNPSLDFKKSIRKINQLFGMLNIQI